MAYSIILYEKKDRSCPVLDFILSLDPKQQAKIYREIDLLEEFGNKLIFPHIRKIEGDPYKNLWEIRIKLASNSFRILYFVIQNNKCVLLHGFKKKTNKTPKKELETALKYMEEVIRRESI